uniref:Uncharacterized protein n=1 Tax=Arundo donax TaxID=35708 RepID=A0A0A9DY92_ARUDO
MWFHITSTQDNSEIIRYAKIQDRHICSKRITKPSRDVVLCCGLHQIMCLLLLVHPSNEDILLIRVEIELHIPIIVEPEVEYNYLCSMLSHVIKLFKQFSFTGKR